MTSYQITKEIRIHHEEDGWFYQFTDDGEGCIQIDYYEMNGITETKVGSSFSISKDCISQFISVLEELK
jgi:predicted GNAT family acetyltransferase